MKKVKILKYDNEAYERACWRKKAERLCEFIGEDGKKHFEMIYPNGQKYYIKSKKNT